MNPNSKLYEHLTSGQFFSADRQTTKDVLQTITQKAKFSARDIEKLRVIEIVAPNESDHYTVLPSSETPVCFLSSRIDDADPETAELLIVGGLARACVISKTTGKNQIESEIQRTLTEWGYPNAKEAGTERAVGA